MNIVYIIGFIVVVRLFYLFNRRKDKGLIKSNSFNPKPIKRKEINRLPIKSEIITLNKWLYPPDEFGKMEKGKVYESQTYESGTREIKTDEFTIITKNNI